MPAFHPSVQSAVAELRRLGVPVLACGQTVFWDEPVKAALGEILDALGPEVEMWLGVHDTDYFSRGSPPAQCREGCMALPHNDFSTRDLWAAAGELSVLFGGEVVPSHENMAENGVSLEKAARAAEQGKAEFLDAITEAWGWRGLVCLGAEHPVAGQVPLSQLLEPLLNLLRWGFDTSLDFLATQEARRRACQVAELIIGWVEAWREKSEQGSLVSLYRELLPRFCSLLLGREAQNLRIFTSGEFLRFDSTTAERPRFHVFALFLDPRTAPQARSAYDAAVRGSGIYELDKFGPGALPFDIVSPSKGRGTLFVTPSSVRVAFECGEVAVNTPQPVEDPRHLAGILEKSLGEGMSLVGKAVVLPLMFCSEFVMALHEGASVYIPLTRKLHGLLREKGLDLALYPILRLRYHTWSSLSASDAHLRLPPHLAAAFQRENITAGDFAATWEEVVARQKALLEHLRRLKTPEVLLAYLSTRDATWKSQAQEWGSAHQTLHETGEWVKCYKMETDSLIAAVARLNGEIAELERRKGALRRQALDYASCTAGSFSLRSPGYSGEGGPSPPVTLQSAREMEELTSQIRDRHAAIRRKKNSLKKAITALKETENDEKAVEARKTIASIEARAELTKALLTRDALLVQGLTRSNFRPTAWWFPLVDPESHWFKEMVRTTELYFEGFDGR